MDFGKEGREREIKKMKRLWEGKRDKERERKREIEREMERESERDLALIL